MVLVIHMRVKKNLGLILVLLGLVFSLSDPNQPDIIAIKLVAFIKEYWSVGMILLGVYFLGQPQNTKTRHKP